MSYNSKIYAECFSELGEIYALKKSGVFCLKLPNQFTPYYDLSYCYPFITPNNCNNLIQDLIEETEFQCFYGVLNPWIEFNNSYEFFDRAFRYKFHYFVELDEKNIWDKLHSTHKRKIKSSLKHIKVTIEKPENVAEKWVELYENLIKKHNIKGLTKFSPSILKKFLLVPGSKIYSAYVQGDLSGLAVFYELNSIVYYHLAAYSDKAYQVSASYGLFWEAINNFREKFSILHLGGVSDSGNTDGLKFFKAGWGSNTIPVYFLAKILNRAKFTETVCISKSEHIKDFFPPYRANYLTEQSRNATY